MLDSGKHLDADIIVTATGLKLQMLGGAKVYIDGQAIDIGYAYSYKAVMIEELPNMVALFGYTNASWTLKIDLACQYVMRLLGYMHQHRYQVVLPQAQTELPKRLRRQYGDGRAILRICQARSTQATQARRYISFTMSSTTI